MKVWGENVYFPRTTDKMILAEQLQRGRHGSLSYGCCGCDCLGAKSNVLKDTFHMLIIINYAGKF